MPVTPWDFSECMKAARMASVAQRDAEKNFDEATEAYAGTEAAYRQELGKEMLRLRLDGMPATLVPDLARGNERVSALKMERDVKSGLLDSAKNAIWRHTADRRDVQSFVRYSTEVNLGRAMQ